MSLKTIVSVAAALGVAAILFLAPLQPLAPGGRAILAIIAAIVVLWSLNFMDSGATALLMLGLFTIVGVPPTQVLSGFAAPPFWLLVTVLFYGFAMKKSGLADRISFSILALCRPSYASILFSFLLIGIVLSIGIPSMTVRTAIMIPIAWSLTQGLGLKSRSAGSALIVLSAMEAAVLPGVALLYGSLWGPFVDRLFRSKGFPLSWLSYAQALALPALCWAAAVIAANLWLLRPAEPLASNGALLQERKRELGGWKRSETVVALLVLASVIFWIMDSRHHLPPFTPGLIAIPVLALSGILTPVEFSTGIPWSLLLFIGSVFSMTTVLEHNQIDAWLAGYLVPMIQPVAENNFLLVSLLACGMLVLRFVDPLGFLALAAFFLPLAEPLLKSGVHPLVLTGALIFASHPFWFPFQNIWLAMSDGITGGEAFSPRQRVIFSTLYALVTLAALMLAVLYWKWTGYL